MNELTTRNHDNVLQADELSRAVYSCSMTARKIIAFGACKIQEKQITTSPFFKSGKTKINVLGAEFKISEILKALNLEHCGKNYEIIKQALEELKTCRIEIKHGEKGFECWNWFQKIAYNEETDNVELYFSQEIGWALMDLKDKYCSLDLKTIGDFKSYYAFRYYEIALSWKGMKDHRGNKKNCWWFMMTVDEIRTTFKIDKDSYKGRMYNFQKRVILEPLEELNRLNPEFEVSVTKITQGRNVIGFKFDCKQKIKQAKILKSDDFETKTEKSKFNREQLFFAKYEKELAELVAYEQQHPTGNFLDDMPSSQQYRAMMNLVKNHQDEYDNL